MHPTCANCGIKIAWRATVVDGRTYCCLGCATGGPCTCDYSNLPGAGEVRALYRSAQAIPLPPHRAAPPARTPGQRSRSQPKPAISNEDRVS